jgi:hypothetical protein
MIARLLLLLFVYLVITILQFSAAYYTNIHNSTGLGSASRLNEINALQMQNVLRL